MVKQITVYISPGTKRSGASALAREAGVSLSHLNRCLRGERKASPELAKKMKAFGLRVKAEADAAENNNQ